MAHICDWVQRYRKMLGFLPRRKGPGPCHIVGGGDDDGSYVSN